MGRGTALMEFVITQSAWRIGTARAAPYVRVGSAPSQSQRLNLTPDQTARTMGMVKTMVTETPGPFQFASEDLGAGS